MSKIYAIRYISYVLTIFCHIGGGIYVTRDLRLIRNDAKYLELVSKELNHLAAILHAYAGGLNFMK